MAVPNQRITKEMVDRVLTQFEADDFLILQNEISEIGYIMEKAHEKGMKIVPESVPDECEDPVLSAGICGLLLIK